MKKLKVFISIFLFFTISFLFGQQKEAFIENVMKETYENSQLEQLGYELLDEIGPRLVGSSNMKTAHDWAVIKFTNWGISATNQQYGSWRGWDRGISHIDLVEPRIKSLEGMQLAWSAATSTKGVTAEVITLPNMIQDSISFVTWLPTVKGKFVFVSMPQKTGRPDYNWEEFATPESFIKMKEDRTAQTTRWNDNLKNSGYSSRTLDEALEKAGAVGIVQSNWSKGFGVNKIFGARTKKIPTVDLSLEDYGLVYRLAENGKKPKIRVVAISKELGIMPTFNTIARIEGTEKSDEYVILSAHFDSWDGGSGATDNATGTITMMEVARILKKFYPNPKRTIIIGLWGSEEQGLNGSRAFVHDNPAIVENIQAVFNQDNGTGRVTSINGQGFLHSYDFLGRWLREVPENIRKHITTTYPGSPSGGGSDHSSFVSQNAPAFMMSSLNWSYFNYTWHTNKDTYDKIVFDDLKNNVALIAVMTYFASEDDEKTSKEKIVLPVDSKSGNQMEWPTPKDATRLGGLN